ncbi:RNA polymerase sigma-70 factor [Maribellus luteus]|uniref:RNA polymerase sigma-70 factor n=1 Tax=Maribellus luteus TaxID=2305463 RepID=A0A399T260_9BACT|nr:RNA polymerase sigma-70 factor [Maribellus luteus]RIJ48043.1 RNA polymerase sigma-70 factor [Maribellus luteus]
MCFEEIYKVYYKRSFLYVKMNVHDNAVAEDIASEALIKLWEATETDSTLNVKPFLFKILRNSSIDYLRRLKVSQKALKEIHQNLNRELDFRISALESCDPTKIFTVEIEEQFKSTLLKLSAKTRQVIEMSRTEGKTNAEIAKELNISEKGVEYHITRALKELRAVFKDYLPIILFFFDKIS